MCEHPRRSQPPARVTAIYLCARKGGGALITAKGSAAGTTVKLEYEISYYEAEEETEDQTLYELLHRKQVFFRHAHRLLWPGSASLISIAPRLQSNPPRPKKSGKSSHSPPAIA